MLGIVSVVLSVFQESRASTWTNSYVLDYHILRDVCVLSRNEQHIVERHMDVLILAAGKSTRFYQDAGVPPDLQGATKLLAKFQGLPLVQHVLDRAIFLVDELKANRVFIAVSDDTVGNQISAALSSEKRNAKYFDARIISILPVSTSTAGTGATAHEAIKAARLTSGAVLILLGDVPLVSPDDLQSLVKAFSRRPHQVAGVVLGVTRPDPDQYGRLDCDDRQGTEPSELRRIIERAQFKRLKNGPLRSRLNQTNLVSAGAYIFDTKLLRSTLRQVLAPKRRRNRGRNARLPEIALGAVAPPLHQRGTPLLVVRTSDYLGTTGIDTFGALREFDRMVTNLQKSLSLKKEFEEEQRRQVQLFLEGQFTQGLGLSAERTINTPGATGSIICKPLDAGIGGDFFAIETLSDGGTAFLLGDGQGHGVQGALHMLPVLAGFKMCCQESLSTKHVLQRVNRLCNELSIHASALYLIMHPADSTGRHSVFASSAGHPPLMVVSEEANVSDFPSDEANQGMMGVSLTISIPEPCRSIAGSDLLVAYTDGISEANRPDADAHAAFGRKGIAKAVLDNLGGSTEEIARAVMKGAEAHSGGRLRDDATVMVLRLR